MARGFKQWPTKGGHACQARKREWVLKMPWKIASFIASTVASTGITLRSLSFFLAGFAIFTNTALLCQFGCCVSICSIDNNFKSTPLKMSMSSTKLSKNHSNFFNMKLPRPHKCFQNLKKHNGKSANATCQLHHPVSNFLLGISKSPAQRASKGVLCNPQRRHLHQRHINGLDRCDGAFLGCCDTLLRASKICC